MHLDCRVIILYAYAYMSPNVMHSVQSHMHFKISVILLINWLPQIHNNQVYISWFIIQFVSVSYIWSHWILLLSQEKPCLTMFFFNEYNCFHNEQIYADLNNFIFISQIIMIFWVQKSILFLLCITFMFMATKSYSTSHFIKIRKRIHKNTQQFLNSFFKIIFLA